MDRYRYHIIIAVGSALLAAVPGLGWGLAHVEHTAMGQLMGLGGLLLLLPLLLVLVFFYLFRRMKLTVEYLKDAKKEVDLLLETTPDSVMAIDQSGTVFRANKTAMTYFGYGDALIGMKVEALMPEASRSGHVHLRLNYFRSPEVRVMAPSRRVQALMGDGEIREVAIKLGFFESLQGPTAVISIRDVTEENLARGALLETQKRIDFAANVAKFGIWEWDAEADRLILDERAYRLHNGDPEAFGGRLNDWLSLVHQEDRENVRHEIKLAIATAKPMEAEYRVRLEDGQIHHLRLSAGLQQNEAAGGQRLTGLCRDITVTRQAQEAMEDARAQALAATEVKSQFLAIMSHEIRTPMNAVLGILTLLDHSKLDERQRQLVGTAHGSASSLLGILNDILDFSKLEAGKVDIVNARFELDEVINKTVDLFSPMASSKGVALYLEMDPELQCHLVGDSLRLSQVLANLVSNAIKFTRAGAVTLAVSSLEVSQGRCTVKFSVRDTGIGMTRNQIKRAMAAFGQANMGTTRDFGGTGLGLPICASLLALMGSELKIDSARNQGTEASFMLRFGFERRSAVRYPKLSAGSRQVLLVFQDLKLRNYVVDSIRPWLGDTIRCENLVTAMATIADVSQDIEFLLTDYSNSEAPGELRGLCQQWRESRPDAGTKVILVHGGDSDPLEDPATRSLNPQVIASPPTPSRLYEALNGFWLRRSGRPSPGDAVTEAVRKIADCRGAHILVVEDVVTNQIIATNFLEMLGMQVDIANDGVEALERVRSRTYDAVLMDFHMPVMNGLEATSAIRKIPSLKHLPIVAMTAAAFGQNRLEGAAVGMDDHLTKPVDIVELADVLVRHLPRRHLQQKDRGEGTTELSQFQKPPATLDTSVLPGALDGDMAMANFGANPRLLQTCLRSFVQEFSDWSDQVRAAGEVADAEATRALLHKLKGAAANIGAKQLASNAFAVWTAGADQGFAGMGELEQQLQALLAEIETTTPEREPPASGGGVKSVSGLTESLESLRNFQDSLGQHRYIPADVLDTWLSKIPPFIAAERVGELQQSVEMLNFVEAKDRLGRILESIIEEMAE